MPTFRFQARWQGVSQLPEDVFENVLYYNVTEAEGTFESVADAIVAAFEAWGFHGGILGAEIRVYSLAGGQPLYSKSYAYNHDIASGPNEVALCLSYAVAPNWEATTPRRRGRIFLGPLVATTSQPARPAAGFITATLALGQALAVAGGAENAWMIYSPTDSTSVAIQAISVDNAWDTQRRRGLAPTDRIVQTV